MNSEGVAGCTHHRPAVVGAGQMGQGHTDLSLTRTSRLALQSQGRRRVAGVSGSGVVAVQGGGISESPAMNGYGWFPGLMAGVDGESDEFGKTSDGIK